MKIIIEIKLGNEAMQTDADVLEAIQRSIRLSLKPLEVGSTGGIRDLNGNTVGGWKVVEDEVSV